MMKTLALCLLGAAVSSSAATLEEVLSRMERAEAEVRTLQFDYSQETVLAVGREPVRSGGTAWFQRPDKFRVEQKSGDPQTVVSDGKRFWIHRPGRGQVLRGTLGRWSKVSGFPPGLTPFRMNVADMKKKYSFSLAEGEPSPVVAMKPLRPQDFPYNLRLWVDMETGLVRRTELSSEAVTAVVTVSSPKVNPVLDRGLFHFAPPPDADVMDMP